MKHISYKSAKKIMVIVFLILLAYSQNIYAENDLQRNLKKLGWLIDELIGESSYKKKPYDNIIRLVASDSQLDPLLIHAIIQHESAYDRFAISPKGARGLMQLMPNTQKEVNVKNPWDPADNIKGGALYFRHLFDRFGNYQKALLAYNCGPANVDKGKIPSVSKLYAKRVLRTWQQLKMEQQGRK